MQDFQDGGLLRAVLRYNMIISEFQAKIPMKIKVLRNPVTPNSQSWICPWTF
jgi:hypothetical protein